MVYKTKFLKKKLLIDYDPAADGDITVELTDDSLAALWITVKADLVAANKCIDTLLDCINTLDVWMGGLNIVHYADVIDAVIMNSLLKGQRPMLIGNGQAIDDIRGVSFPILFGAPYINPKMALPKSDSNRKNLILNLDIATAYYDDLLLDITEVILPDNRPIGFIKQEQVQVGADGTGDKDIKLQTNWDLLKLLFRMPTVPVDATWAQTLNYAGLEIDDFVFGYQTVPWTILHGELMDELGGMMGIENHTHTTLVPDETGMPSDLETYIRLYGLFDFFFENDESWRAPIAGASSAKIKANFGVDEAWRYVQANYCEVRRVEAKILKY